MKILQEQKEAALAVAELDHSEHSGSNSDKDFLSIPVDNPKLRTVDYVKRVQDTSALNPTVNSFIPR